MDLYFQCNTFLPHSIFLAKVLSLNLVLLLFQNENFSMQTIKSSKNKAATKKVRVTINSAEEEGFFVYGKLSYEQAKDIKRYRFNKPTQNASEDFVPGYYLFWLEKDKRIGKPELYLIMSDGTDAGKDLILKTP